MKILFWNTHKNAGINDTLSSLIIENDVSIVALAEYMGNANDLINRLDINGKCFNEYPAPGCDRIVMFGSVHDVDVGPQSSYTSIQILNQKDILCCVHLPSKAFPDHKARREIIVDGLIEDIRRTENNLGTENTVVVGDFNINPYEPTCVEARYFHGNPFFEETLKKKRIVQGREFYMFYNPMWNFFGDFQPPFGTYYYSKGSSDATFWNIYDQVMIRPELRSRFVDKSLNILTTTEKTSLLDDDGHPKKSISDHLPIIFEIKEE